MAGNSSWLAGANAVSNARDRDEAQSLQQQQVKLNEESADLLRNKSTVESSMAYANDLGILDPTGTKINAEKLTSLLTTARESGNFSPALEGFVTSLGNSDYSVRNNPGFAFEGLTEGPGGTLTMRGTYDGQEGDKYLTEGAETEQEAPVVFSSTEQVANMASNQFNVLWNKPGMAATKLEITKKYQLSGSAQQLSDSAAKVDESLGLLTDQVDRALHSLGRTDIARKLKGMLAQPGMTRVQQLALLQKHGASLNVPVEEIITEEVQAAIAEEESAAQAPAAPAGTSNTGPASDEEIADFRKQNPTIFPQATRETLARLVEGEKFDYKRGNPASTSNTGPASDEEIADFRKQNPTIFPQATRETLARLVEGEKFDYKRGNAAAPQPAESSVPDSVKAVATRVDAASEEDVMAGRVKMTQDEIVDLQESLKAMNITSFSDMKRATREQQLGLLSYLSTNVKDPTQRAEFGKQLKNMIETGTLSYDAKTAGEAQVAKQNADSTSSKAKTDEYSAKRQFIQLSSDIGEIAAKYVVEASGKVEKALFGTDDDGVLNPDLEWNEGRVRREVFGQNGAFTTMFNKMKIADKSLKANPNNITKQTRDTYRTELNNMFSATLQAANESGEYEWSWTTTDSAPGVFGDDTFARIQMSADEASFSVIDPASGMPTGDDISSSDLIKILGRQHFNDFKNQLAKK